MDIQSFTYDLSLFLFFIWLFFSLYNMESSIGKSFLLLIYFLVENNPFSESIDLLVMVSTWFLVSVSIMPRIINCVVSSHIHTDLWALNIWLRFSSTSIFYINPEWWHIPDFVIWNYVHFISKTTPRIASSILLSRFFLSIILYIYII